MSLRTIIRLGLLLGVCATSAGAHAEPQVSCISTGGANNLVLQRVDSGGLDQPMQCTVTCEYTISGTINPPKRKSFSCTMGVPAKGSGQCWGLVDPKAGGADLTALSCATVLP